MATHEIIYKVNDNTGSGLMRWLDGMIIGVNEVPGDYLAPADVTAVAAATRRRDLDAALRQKLRGFRQRDLSLEEREKRRRHPSLPVPTVAEIHDEEERNALKMIRRRKLIDDEIKRLGHPDNSSPVLLDLVHEESNRKLTPAEVSRNAATRRRLHNQALNDGIDTNWGFSDLRVHHVVLVDLTTLDPADLIAVNEVVPADLTAPQLTTVAGWLGKSEAEVLAMESVSLRRRNYRVKYEDIFNPGELSDIRNRRTHVLVDRGTVHPESVIEALPVIP